MCRVLEQRRRAFQRDLPDRQIGATACAVLDYLVDRARAVTDQMPADAPHTRSSIENRMGEDVEILRVISVTLTRMADLMNEGQDVIDERRHPFIGMIGRSQPRHPTPRLRPILDADLQAVDVDIVPLDGPLCGLLLTNRVGPAATNHAGTHDDTELNRLRFDAPSSVADRPGSACSNSEAAEATSTGPGNRSAEHITCSPLFALGEFGADTFGAYNEPVGPCRKKGYAAPAVRPDRCQSRFPPAAFGEGKAAVRLRPAPPHSDGGSSRSAFWLGHRDQTPAQVFEHASRLVQFSQAAPSTVDGVAGLNLVAGNVRAAARRTRWTA
jgi:hypothetical protein